MVVMRRREMLVIGCKSDRAAGMTTMKEVLSAWNDQYRLTAITSCDRTTAERDVGYCLPMTKRCRRQHAYKQMQAHKNGARQTQTYTDTKIDRVRCITTEKQTEDTFRLTSQLRGINIIHPQRDKHRHADIHRHRHTYRHQRRNKHRHKHRRI